MLAAACETLNRRRIVTVIAGSALAISLAIFFLLPSLKQYRGLSGIDSALYAMLAIALLRQRPRTVAKTTVIVIGIIGFVAKVCWEIQSGTLLFASADGALVPLPLAHVAGFLAGATAGRNAPR